MLDAGVEVSGVASKSFVATLVRLLELEVLLAGAAGELDELAARVDAAADAVDDLLARRASWIDDAVDELAGPHGTWLLSPLERWCSAMQGALMLREVPRRPAVGCETGEWSHVDVYLTKTLDYRALVFAGSPWDAQATDWLASRGSKFWAVGGELAGAARTLRYAGDTDPVVALLAEITVAELLAAALI
jgi:glucosamine 6-phosphate synthetase-like amidotransferase/phosphosugar isomerase protein